AQIGGVSDNYISIKHFLPFQERDFEMVQKTFSLEANETLQTFWGINNNFPLPPTLNFTGRGGLLITPADLGIIHPELTAVYGYPNWLSVTIKDFLLYDMQQKNLEFNQNILAYVDDLEQKLKDFANSQREIKLKIDFIFSFTQAF
ncbi:MAG: hypothetical protein ACK40K_04835, partial [Raineya sp.]